MKIILSIVCSFCLVILAHAQSPNQLQYQAIIRNASGAVVSNQAVGMRVSLLKSSASGTVVYAETHRDTTTTNGLVTVEIGAGTVVSGSFASVNWGQGPYFIKTETDISGGTNYTLYGTSQLLSVPYALYANDVPVSKSGDTISIGTSRLIIPGSTLISNAAPATLNEGLLAYYPFNGNANDESGNNRNATVYGATLAIDRNGLSNTAYSFNGTNNYINIPLTSPLTGTSGTINTWIKSNGQFTSQRSIIGQSQGRPQLVVSPARKATIQWKATNTEFPSCQSTTEADNGQWMMITGIYTSNSFKIYINGVLQNSTSTSFTQDNCSKADFQIGGYYVTSNPCQDVLGYSQMFNGILDDIRIYNRELTQQEISYLYKN